MILKNYRQMTRRFCETRVMSEYHSRKPYFMSCGDDLYSGCNHSVAPCDEMWKKFELYSTPPSSPKRENDEITTQLVPDPISCDLNFADCDFESSPLSDYGDDVAGFHDDVMCDGDDKMACQCESQQKLIKDCMWNGVGHKVTAALRKAHSRNTSPRRGDSPRHPTGCVDPRNIFPYPVGQPAQCEKQNVVVPGQQRHHRPILDGAETVSDSEEEIDVVTVEKSQNSNLFKAKKGLTNPSRKIVAHLVPKNGKLSIVTTSCTNLVTKGLIRTIAQNNEVQRGRARNKFHVFAPTTTSSGQQAPRTVSMATESAGNVKQAVIATAGLKRRHTVDESSQLMKMANPKHLMQRGGDSTSPAARCDQKRVLSLEGVSFCATTGVRHNVSSVKKAATLEVHNTVEIGSNMKMSKVKIQEIKHDDVMAGIQTDDSPPLKKRRKVEALARMMSATGGSDSEQIRAAHNVLERQRREGLRASFLTLRDNVPELQSQDKAPKVHILNKARDYCVELQDTEKNLLAEKERLNRRHKKLLERLKRFKMPTPPEESDVESETGDASYLRESPLSSLPPSPTTYQSAFYIASRVSSDNPNSPQEVVLRLEPQRRKGLPVHPQKQTKCQAELRAIIASLQKNPEVTNFRQALSPRDSLSDGFECLDSEEELLGVTY